MINVDMRHALTEQKKDDLKQETKFLACLIMAGTGVLVIASLCIQTLCSGSNVCM